MNTIITSGKSSRNKLTKYLVPIFILLVGVVVLLLAYDSYHKKTTFPETSATIESITSTTHGKRHKRTSHTVTVSYTVDGTSYRSHLDEYKKSFHKGNTITIRYNPDNPKDIVYSDTSGVIVYFIVGGILCLSGAIVLVYVIFSRRRN